MGIEEKESLSDPVTKEKLDLNIRNGEQVTHNNFFLSGYARKKASLSINRVVKP